MNIGVVEKTSKEGVKATANVKEHPGGLYVLFMGPVFVVLLAPVFAWL